MFDLKDIFSRILIQYDQRLRVDTHPNALQAASSRLFDVSIDLLLDELRSIKNMEEVSKRISELENIRKKVAVK